MKRFRQFEKPETRFSNRAKWVTYFSSYVLQFMAFVKVLFTGREVKYAFFFSKKQDAICRDLESDRTVFPTFNGKYYSECSRLKNGWNNWNDSKLIGVGSDSDIKLTNN